MIQLKNIYGNRHVYASPKWLNVIRFVLRALIRRDLYARFFAPWFGWPVLDGDGHPQRTYLRINDRTSR